MNMNTNMNMNLYSLALCIFLTLKPAPEPISIVARTFNARKAKSNKLSKEKKIFLDRFEIH